MGIDLSSLVQLGFQGDLESFLAAWDYTLMALTRFPDEELFLALLEAQLRKCRALGPAFVVYDGAPEGSPTRTSKYLYDAPRQEVMRKQRKAVRDALTRPPAKAVPGKPQVQQKSPAEAQKPRGAPSVRSTWPCICQNALGAPGAPWERRQRVVPSAEQIQGSPFKLWTRRSGPLVRWSISTTLSWTAGPKRRRPRAIA